MELGKMKRHRWLGGDI